MTWSSPFEHEFMRTALLMAVMVGTVCAVFSCFLVLKGWSLMGDAVAHAVLPGIVVAYWAGLPLSVGAFASGLLCAVGSGYIRSRSRVKEDTVLGVVFTGLFGLGLVLFTKVESDQHLNHILFGNLLGIPRGELMRTWITGFMTLVLILLRHRDLLLFCFDPGHARSIGLSPTRLNLLLLALLALTIVTALQAVGVILVVAMLVTPGCLGFLMADRFPRMLAFAVGSAVVAGITGTYVSFFLNGSTGACIVLVQAMLFIVALILSPKKGLEILRGRGRKAAERSIDPAR
jgi:ABC-type Mn2+/Zn2+ transport system permease subunit